MPWSRPDWIQTGVWLPRDVHRDLKRLAVDHQIPLREEVTQAVRAHLEQMKSEEISSEVDRKV